MKVWLVIYLFLYGWGMIPEIGVVDRIEGEKAVILLERSGAELVIIKEWNGITVQEDSWLLLVRRNNDPVILQELAGLADRHRKKSQILVGELREWIRLQHSPNRTGISTHIQKYRFVR